MSCLISLLLSGCFLSTHYYTQLEPCLLQVFVLFLAASILHKLRLKYIDIVKLNLIFKKYVQVGLFFVCFLYLDQVIFVQQFIEGHTLKLLKTSSSSSSSF